MRLIDADSLKLSDFQDFSNTDVFCAIDDEPTVDIETVLCEECEWYNTNRCPAYDSPMRRTVQ